MQLNLEALARIVSAKMGVKVRVENGARTFSTNGNDVIIPAYVMDDGSFNANERAVMLRGGIAHEGVGHCRHTDFGAVKGRSELASSLINALEDIRIEALAAQVYPGCRTILRELAALAETRGFWDVEPTDAVEELIVFWPLRHLRETRLKQPLDPVRTAALRASLEAQFGAEIIGRMLELATQAGDATDTSQVKALAERILDLLNEQPPASPPPSPKDESGSGDESSDSGSESGSGDESSDSGASPARLDESVTVDASADAFIESAFQGVRHHQSRSPVRVSEMPMCPHAPDAIAQGLAARLRSGLREKLRAWSEDEDDRLCDFGRFNANRISAALAGDRMVFTEEGEPASGLSTSCLMLIDMSGSMGKHRGTVHAVSDALISSLNEFRTCGVEFAVYYFNSSIMQVKRFDEGCTSDVRKRAHSYTPMAGTDWAGCALKVLPDLATRKMARKVLLTVTDGCLGNWEPVVETLRAEGMEDAYLGIGVPNQDTSKLKSYMTVSAHPSAQDLQGAIFAALERAIRPEFT